MSLVTVASYKGTDDTTVFHIPSSNSKSPLLIFLPGNPGFIHYYTHYLSLIHEALKSSVDIEVLGISHAGFEAETKHCNRVFTLDEQVKHKIEIIENFLEKDIEKRDIYIFGHSVGAFIAQRVVSDSNENSRIRKQLKFIGLITPTIIDIHKSTKGQRLLTLSQYLPNINTYISKLTYLTRLLPEFLLDKAVNHAMRNSTILDSFTITKKFITNEHIVKQSLGLAIEEMNLIQDTWEYNYKFMKDFSKVKKWFFFTNPDNWVALNTQIEIQRKLVDDYTENSIDRDDDIGHSFCIDHSVEFSTITLKRLNEVLSDI